MATTIWSYTSSTSNSADQGNDWQIFSLSKSSGNKLTDNAIISNVEYTVKVYIGGHVTSTSYKFQLYAIAVKDGPYTGTNYDADKAGTGSNANTLTFAVQAKTSSSDTSESNTNVSSEQQNGTVKVWRSGSGTACRAIDCDFVNNKNTPKAFKSEALSVQLRMNYSGSLRAYVREISIKVTYTEPSLTAPSNITITQHTTDSKYNISWNKATGSNGSGTVKYKVYYGKSVSGTDAATNLVSGGSEITGTSISNIDLPGYGLYDFKVEALYSGLTTSLSVAEEFYGPSVTIPSTGPVISPTTGDSVTLSWGESSYSYTSGDPIKYQVRYQLDTGSEAYYSTDPVSGTSLTITGDWLEGKGAKDGSVIKFRVRARGGTNLTNNLENKTYIYSDYTSYSDDFTYDGKYTVGYNDGTAWQACVVYYNDGTDWIECIPYYNDGTAWQPIKTKV